MFLKKLKIELPYDPAAFLLCIYLKITNTMTEKDIRTSKFTAASFKIAKIWKQLKCPLMDEGIRM